MGEHGKGSEAGNKVMKYSTTGLEDSIRVRKTGEVCSVRVPHPGVWVPQLGVWSDEQCEQPGPLRGGRG